MDRFRHRVSAFCFPKWSPGGEGELHQSAPGGLQDGLGVVLQQFIARLLVQPHFSGLLGLLLGFVGASRPPLGVVFDFLEPFWNRSSGMHDREREREEREKLRYHPSVFPVLFIAVMLIHDP